MRLNGVLRFRNGSLFFLYETTNPLEPFHEFSWWRIPGQWHSYLDGTMAYFEDSIAFRGVSWSDGFGQHKRIAFDSTRPDSTERVSAPSPHVRRGIEVRWHDGQWQKLLKKGWVPA